MFTGESKSLTDTQICSELEEGISSFDHCCPEGDNTNKDWADSVENGFHNCGEDCISGKCFLKYGSKYFFFSLSLSEQHNLISQIPCLSLQPGWFPMLCSSIHREKVADFVGPYF